MDIPPQRSEPSKATLRASDADRERVASLLQENYAEGRLTYVELQERLERTYGGMTLGELATLTADLPATTAPNSAPTAPPIDSTRAKRVRERVLTYVILMLFLVAIWAASGRHGSFWPIWPITIGAFILAFDVLGLERPGGRGRRRRMARYEGETDGRPHCRDD